jgi:hypothetical protein
MVILDENQGVCGEEDKVSDHLSDAKTIIFDYKEHVVLQFITLEKEENEVLVPVFKFKFVPYAVACEKGKKMKYTLKDLVESKDVVS